MQIRLHMQLNSTNTTNTNSRACAINLFGLPRAFESLVLPSLIQNVIEPNKKYGCDYFVHYYHLEEEVGGRSGGGGTIDPSEVLKLEAAVQKASQGSTAYNYYSPPVVKFVFDTEQEFWAKYTTLVEKIRNTKDTEGNYLYFPYKARTYKYPGTTDNIVKMWHSIERSFALMKEHEAEHSIKYDRVAMIRADVLYATPMDVYYVNETIPMDTENRFTVIPGFGRYPVSDRLIYGPSKAVELWATQRFNNLDKHVQMIYKSKDKGFGMHSERFVGLTLLPLIKKAGYEVYEHDTLCFFRARPDETVWVTDCTLNAKPSVHKNLPDARPVLKQILGRECGPKTRLTASFSFVNCSRTYGSQT